MFLIYNRIFNFEINFIIENKNTKNNKQIFYYYLGIGDWAQSPFSLFKYSKEIIILIKNK